MNAELTDRNPYPGPRPFEPQEENLFFGREREVGELLSLIIAHRAVLLYAQSGAGKTSILNAKLIPALTQKGFEVLPLARVRGFEPEEADRKGIDNIYVFNTVVCWEEAQVSLPTLASVSLADFLQKREHKKDEGGTALPRAVIFDQFEELFTFYPERWRDREAFFRQVNEALQKDSLLRVLFVIREDYLAELDPYSCLLPEELQIRYRLERLRPEAACRAIEGPLQGSGRSFAAGVASQLVEQLLTIQVEAKGQETTPVSGKWRSVKVIFVALMRVFRLITRVFHVLVPLTNYHLVTGEYVEPVQLQVVCQKLWGSLPPKELTITADHLEQFGDVDKALSSFYETAVAVARTKTRVREKRLRHWFESHLITPTGTRGTIFQGSEWTGSVRNEVIDVLVDQHIVRTEARARARWCELTHDRLIEPIRRSNAAWYGRRTRRRSQFSGLVLIGLVVVFLGLCLVRSGTWHADAVPRSAVINDERLKQVFDRHEDWRKEREMKVQASVERLWKAQELAPLVAYLKGSQDSVPQDFGLTLSPSRQTVAEPPEPNWPLTLEYHPDRVPDELELRAQWRDLAVAFGHLWGIPAPLRIKLARNPSLPIDEVAVVAPIVPSASDISAQRQGKSGQARVAQSAQQERPPGSDREQHLSLEPNEIPGRWTVSIPWQPSCLLITEARLPERLVRFFDDYCRNESIRMSQVQGGGPWWLLPRWTQPLWQVAGHEAYRQEAAIALRVTNYFLDNAEALLTRDCVSCLLERAKEQYPQTVAEALSARGGVDGIRRDLVEIVRARTHSLTRLPYLLDVLANDPDLSASEAAKEAVADQMTAGVHASVRLRGRPDSAPMPREGQERGRTSVRVSKAYAEASAELANIEPPIRTYLGQKVRGSIATEKSEVRPDVLEAIADLRGDLYRQFGFIMPAVLFRPTEDELADDCIRIEVVNETKGDEDAKPIRLMADQTIEQLLGELRFRYVAGRTCWLTAEKAQSQLEGLPDYLRKWLEARLSLTDVKMILREVIAPTRAELHAHAVGKRAGDGLTHTTPRQTLRDLPWLLGSLTFWMNAIDAPAVNAQRIAECLGRTQGARLNPTPDQRSRSAAALKVQDGIKELAQGNTEAAEKAFKDGLQSNKDEAIEAFLTFYPKQSNLAPEKRLQWLEGLCRLPDPGSSSTVGLPDTPTRYELEEFLNAPAMEIPGDAKRSLQLCLLWNYLEEKHYRKRDQLVDQLLSGYNRNEWSAKEEYFLAYHILKAHAGNEAPLQHQDKIEGLLLNAFERLPDRQADEAFSDLVSIYSTVPKPPWYWGMLESIEKRRPKSYWIPYLVGAYRARADNELDLRKSLVFFDHAEANVENARGNPAVQRAWLNFGRATAYVNLVELDPTTQRLEDCQRAVVLLEGLAETVPALSGSEPNEARPMLQDIYNYLAVAYRDSGRAKDAVTVLQKAVSLVRDNGDLLLNRLGGIYYDNLFEYKAAYETYGKIKLKPDDVSYRANFAEACLGAEHFEEASNQAGKVLTLYAGSQILTPSEELAMRFVKIAALTLQGRIDEADESLKEFISRYKSLVGSSYKGGWTYRGTRHFFEERVKDESQKKLLLKLLNILEKPDPDVTLERITAP